MTVGLLISALDQPCLVAHMSHEFDPVVETAASRRQAAAWARTPSFVYRVKGSESSSAS